MDSSATLTTYHHPKPLPKQLDSARKHPPSSRSSRRTPSFSSSSAYSFSPYNSSSSLESVLYFAGAGDDDHPCPYSPVRFSGGGVPFSWEHLPGIPKKEQTCFKKKLIQESSMKLLPLPPPTKNNTTIKTSSHNNYNKKNNSLQSIFQRDPFFAAMVECSKSNDREEEEELSSRNSNGRGSGGSNNNNNNNNNRVSRSISDRFGFVNLYSSCKNASAISESIILLPSSSSRRSRSNYQHFSHRRRSLSDI